MQVALMSPPAWTNAVREDGAAVAVSGAVPGRPKPRSGSCGMNSDTSPIQKIARKIMEAPSQHLCVRAWFGSLFRPLKWIGKIERNFDKMRNSAVHSERPCGNPRKNYFKFEVVAVRPRGAVLRPCAHQRFYIVELCTQHAQRVQVEIDHQGTKFPGIETKRAASAGADRTPSIGNGHKRHFLFSHRSLARLGVSASPGHRNSARHKSEAGCEKGSTRYTCHPRPSDS